MNLDDIWIVSQGPLQFYDQIKDQYTEFQVIHSAWTTDRVIKSNSAKEVFIYKKPPIFSGRGNINFQSRSTLAGLLEAKRLGAKYVLKMRSDFSISDLKYFLSALKFKIEKDDGLFFLSFVTHEGGYFMDFVQFGKTDDLIDLWSIGYKINYLHRRSPEVYLTRRFEKIFAAFCPGSISYKYARYILPIIYNNNLKIYWHKRNVTSDDWRGNPMFLFADDAQEIK